jgi:coenzyme F420-reducing hydrogenase delta subunit
MSSIHKTIYYIYCKLWEVMMLEAMENGDEGIVVGGQVVGDVKFADDQSMVSSSEGGLQRLIDRLNDTGSTCST